MTFGGDGHVAQSTAASDAVSVEEPPFHSAQAAIRFAVTREGSPGRPLASRMVDTVVGGRGFVGFDGAAQAGIILSHIEALGRVPFAALVALCAPPVTSCHCGRPCCSGRRSNALWREAINTLAEEASEVLPSRVSYAMRSEILVKIYGRSLTLKRIADDLQVDVDTVSKHHRAVQRWLAGAPAGRHGESAIEGVETAAWREAETVLREAGIVGGS